MGFLDGLQTKGKARPQDVVARAFGTKYSFSSSYSPYRNDWDIQRALEKGLEKDLWVYRCVETIATSQANLPIDVKKYNYTNDGETISDANIYKVLNRRPNPVEDSQAFRFRLSAILLLSKKGAFVEVIRNQQGNVEALYLLDPATVNPIPHPKKFVDKYVIERADGVLDEIAPENMIWLKIKPHPVDPYRQLTPMEVAGVSVETDYLARLFNRNFLKNDGRPGLLITIDGDIQAEDAQEINNRFAGGASTAGKTMVLEAKGVNMIDMSSKPRDVQWKEAIEGAKDDILGAFGVPPSILGNAEGRCLRQSELIHLADGTAVPARTLVNHTFKLLQPRANGVVTVDAEATWNGREKIYKITTFSGRTLETNGKHPLFMASVKDNARYKSEVIPQGWTSMVDIKAHWERNDLKNTGVFTEVAVPYAFYHDASTMMDEDEAYAMGYDLIEPNDELFKGTNASVVAYLGGLYSAHGMMSQHTSFDVAVPTFSFAKKLQRLLLHLGVYSNVGIKKNNHLVSIGNKVNMLNFAHLVPIDNDNAVRVEKVKERLNTKTMEAPVKAWTNSLPPDLMWDRVYSVEEIGEDETVAVTVPEGKTYLSLFWEHNTYNNADAELENFWTTTMVNHCGAIARGMDNLTGILGDDIFLAYDFSSVEVLQRAKRRKLDKDAQDLARGVISVDDYREKIGERRLNIAATRVLINPRGLIYGDAEDVEEVRNLPVVGAGTGQRGAYANINPFTGQSTGDGQIGGMNDALQSGQSFANSDSATMSLDQVAARAQRSAEGLGTTVDAVSPNATAEVMDRVDYLNEKADKIAQYDSKTYRQGVVEALSDSLTTRQFKVIMDRLDHAKVRKGTPHWDGEGSGEDYLDTTYLVQEDWLADSAVDDIERIGGIKREDLDTIENSVISYTRKAIREADDAGFSIKAIKDMLFDLKDDMARSRRNYLKGRVQ